MDSFDAALAVAANAVVLTGLLLRHGLEILAAAIESIVIEEDGLEAFRRRKDFAVKVAQAVLAIDFAMPNGVTLPSVTLGPVAPLELGEERIVGVVNENDLALRCTSSINPSSTTC
jgi:hypothetical protein